MGEQASAIEFSFGSLHFELQQAILVWLCICLAFAIFFIYAGKKIEKADPYQASHGLVYFCEELYNIVLYVIKPNLKNKTDEYVPLIGTLILLMFTSNVIDLIGWQNPTSNLSVDMTIAIMMFLLIQGNAIKKAGLRARLKELASPKAIFFPLNLLDQFTLPVSLTMRLFGNILSGTIISLLIYTLMKTIMPWGILLFAVTPFIHAFFGIFIGLIQTYIFFNLATYYLGEHVAKQE